MEAELILGTAQEKKHFYRWVLSLSVPLILQGLMNSLVSAADVMMLSYISQEALSASSLAGQITFVQEMLVAGVSSGATILTAQYWGKGEKRVIERILAMTVKMSIFIGLLFSTAAFVAPQLLMRIFTNDEVLIFEGSKYLRAMAPAYLMSSASATYLAVMRSIERVRISAIINSSAVLMNVILNACFIFGVGPFPALGITGVALATSITRIIEAFACVADAKHCCAIKVKVHDFLEHNKVLFKDFFHFAAPAAANDIIWGVAFSIYAIILGHLSSDIVAANSVTSVVRNLGTVVCYAVAKFFFLVNGKTKGDTPKSKTNVYARRFLKLTILTAAFGTCVILLCRVPIMRYMEAYVQLTEKAHEEMNMMLFINAWYIWGTAINTVFICGIFRAGGDVRFGLICDTIDMWGYAVPAGLIAAFVLKIPEMWVYIVLCLDEFVKMPIVFRHYFKEKWLQNVTRENIE